MTTRTAILTGRFAPFCNVHLGQIWQALKENDEVVVVVTDADLAPSSRLPWSADEREAMCRAALADFGDKVRFVQIDAAPRRLQDLALRVGSTGPVLTALAEEEEAALAALYDGNDEALQALVPTAILAQITALRQSQSFAGLTEEHRYIEDYKTAWKAAPYPVIMVTVDTLIFHSGHVLLIERGRIPGKGLWALPGGFVEGDEWLEDAALRELCEETGLHLESHEARQRLKGSHVFDDPWRSARGRVVTHAFHFELDGSDQPHVSGQDDAAAARWVPLDEVKAMRGRFFEDHGRIISHFLGI